MARDLYDAMETARCEAIGARAMPGTAGNIDAKIGSEAERKGYAQIEEAAGAPLAIATGYLIRHLATGRDLPPAAQNVMDLWREHIEHEAAGTLGDLEATLADQARFARFARKIIEDILTGNDKIFEDPEPVVRLHELADSSVNFVARPWTKTSDYWDVYWEVTEAVKRELDAAGISIPYPQRQVHVVQAEQEGAGTVDGSVRTGHSWFWGRRVWRRQRVAPERPVRRPLTVPAGKERGFHERDRDDALRSPRENNR